MATPIKDLNNFYDYLENLRFAAVDAPELSEPDLVAALGDLQITVLKLIKETKTSMQ